MIRFNIAIDGPSAAGKSTIAKILAKELGYAHLDTGAMYRCVGYYSKLHHVDQKDEDALVAMMKEMEIAFDSDGHVFINQEDVSTEIRQNDISMMASNVSAFLKVRAHLVNLQQKIAANKGYILDGRDIGTVVLPDAEIKIFMVASVEARAKRRYKEYLDKQIEADYDVIYKDIETRDYQDTHRATSPLKKAEDALEIDTSAMSIDEVVIAIQSYISAKLG